MRYFSMETPILNEHNKEEYPPMHTGGFNTSVILLLLPILMMVVSCHRNNEQYIRQTYYIDDNICVCLRPIQSTYGDKAEIAVIIGGKEGICEISYRENPYSYHEIAPYIYDVYEDTIVVMYEMTHTPWTKDTEEVWFVEQVDVEGYGKYVVKGICRNFYNGWSVGKIDGMFWDEDYSYAIDSVVNIKDSFYVYKGTDNLYRAHQRDVEWVLENGYWKVSYIDSFLNADGYVYKMRNDIRFVEKRIK